MVAAKGPKKIRPQEAIADIKANCVAVYRRLHSDIRKARNAAALMPLQKFSANMAIIITKYCLPKLAKRANNNVDAACMIPNQNKQKYKLFLVSNRPPINAPRMPAIKLLIL